MSLSFDRRTFMLGALASGGSALLRSAPAADTPAFLSPARTVTLTSVGERIIPGSSAAQCDRLIDLVLSIETPEARDHFIHALDMFETEAQRRHQTSFHTLSPAQQDALLTEVSRPEQPLLVPFTVVKEWLADAYWSSQQGLRELGWKGRMAWSNFPGCPDPANHSSG